MKLLNGSLAAFTILLSSCGEPNHLPKPRMYPKIEFPDTKYILYHPDYCPFEFEFASYANLAKDTSFFGEKPEHECWFNLEIPVFNGALHCSYYPVNNAAELQKYIKDSYKMAREHQIKANYIDEMVIHKPNQISGILYNMEGPSASPFQFYLTDSSKHFFRGALYFNTPARPDSLQPIVEFVKRDVMQIINSFHWKN